MPLHDSKYLQSAYQWTIRSLLRVLAVAMMLTAGLGLVYQFGGVWPGAVLTILLLFAAGATAHGIRETARALDYPGVDRFFQQVPCYLTIQDRHLRIIRTNRRFREDFGDSLGEYCYKVIKKADKPCPNCPVLRTFADGQTHRTEEIATTRDGHPAHLSVYTTPIPDEQGNIIGVMEMSTNITDLKQLQAEIEASRDEYQSLFSCVPCYISVQDKDLRIIESNEAFNREFGQHLGKHCYEVYKQRGEMCPDCPVEKTFQDGNIYSREETVIARNGTEAKMLVFSSPIYNQHGERVAVMEMSTDITEVKRLQRELTHMGKTIAVMAHRIKNILMGLEGGIFVVNTGMADGDEALVRKGWGMIERNVDIVSRIVKDLLYCSKEREMSFAVIDPAPVVQSVFELFRGRTAKEGVKLHAEIPDSLPHGRFDEEALHSLTTNLVTNALEACVNDATPGKEEHRIVIRALHRDGKHLIEVEDNGAGIPGTVGERVFEDFFSTRGREGTGLGLLVAHKIVEEHGGVITFSSTEGEGTTFRAIFPNHARRSD